MEEDLLEPGSVGGTLGSTPATNGSTSSTVDVAFSVTSDSSEQGYSSDSGKGCSGSDTLTPPASSNDTETVVAQWNLCPAYSLYTAYSDSLGKILPNHAMIYEFEIPQNIVGRLIGRYGTFVNKIKISTGANIIVKRHHIGGGLKICAVEGVCSEIDKAISMIRERFPLKKFPTLTLEQVNPHIDQVPPSISFLPSNNKLSLIQGVVNDVTVSCVVSLDHIFVQQPTHPTYPALSRLHEALKSVYGQSVETPLLSRPFNTGVICVAQINNDDWFRAEVVAVHEEKSQVTARLVDVGGYVKLPINSLRQIRVDFVTIPFQATECRLANVTPINEEKGWSEEAINYFKNTCQKQLILHASVVGYSPIDNVPVIHLYRLSKEEDEEVIFNINDELVKLNYAKWIDEAVYYTAKEEINDLSQNFDELTILPAGLAYPSDNSSASCGYSSSTDELNGHESMRYENDTPFSDHDSQVTLKESQAEPCSSNLSEKETGN